MNSTLTRFESPIDGHQLRIIDVEGEPWFVARDVATILGYGSTKDMTRTLDADEKGGREMPTLGGTQIMGIISEGGLYKVLVQRQTGRMADSDVKARVKTFQRWVTHEVLPTIRRTGQYAAPMGVPAEEGALTRTQTVQMALDYIRTTKELEETKSELDYSRSLVAAHQEHLKEVMPKAIAFDSLLNADGDVSVNEAAKILSRDHNIQIGERRLFDKLEEWGWIYRRSGRLTPYQRTVDDGRLNSRGQTYEHPRDGHTVLAAPQVRVTGKGLEAIYRKLTSI